MSLSERIVVIMTVIGAVMSTSFIGYMAYTTKGFWWIYLIVGPIPPFSMLMSPLIGALIGYWFGILFVWVEGIDHYGKSRK